MATLIVPPLEAEPWPTLGPDVEAFIKDAAVYGPGDLEGQPYRLTEEFRGQLYRAYEVYPKGHRLAGRRRFKQVSLEERKGTAKTERAMVIALAESHPEAPVRFDGWRPDGTPVGKPLMRPYIPLVSYTVEQTEDLAYNVLRFIIENSPVADDYDVNEERILVIGPTGRAAGKIVPLAGSPNARDGALTTFQHFDEPHRMALSRLKKAFSTMKENTYKRVGADAWTLTTSTAGEPGEGSVEEEIHDYAEQVAAGKVDDPRLFFFSRFAPESMPMDTPEQVRAFLLEASGEENAEWSGDLDALGSRWFEPKTDRAYYRRVWGNQWVPGGGQAYDPERWRQLARPQLVVPDGELIVAGVDGARFVDALAIIATDVLTGQQWPLDIIERPDHATDDYEHDFDRADLAMTAAFERWEMWRVYIDPQYIGTLVDRWKGRWGEKRIIEWFTNRPRQIGYAVRNHVDAVKAGDLTHNGDEVFARHIGNARKQELSWLDEEGKPLYSLRKERPDSPRKIDGSMGAVLAWEARSDAIAAGAKKKSRKAVFV